LVVGASTSSMTVGKWFEEGDGTQLILEVIFCFMFISLNKNTMVLLERL
jgi:hypothetical protein